MTRLHAAVSMREQGCARVRRLLDSYHAGELTVETNHEILDHLTRCVACQTETDARDRLRATLRRVGGEAPEPPAGLEAAVRARVRATPSSRPRVTAALALAAVVALGSSFLLLRNHPSPAVDGGAFAAAATVQLDCALENEWPAKAPDRDSVIAEASPVYRAALRAATARPGYELLAAHDCGHGGPLAFHIVLRQEGSEAASGLVSVLIFRKTKGSLPPATILASEGGVVLTGGKTRGFDVVSAETPRSLLFVVTGNGRKESIELGRAILPALAATL